MGSLEYMIGSAVIDAATKQQEMQTLLNGKTPEQQAIIKFFYGAKGGCLSSDKGMTVEEYRKKVRERIASLNTKEMALRKLGIEEEEVKEIAPVTFEGYIGEAPNFDVPKVTPAAPAVQKDETDHKTKASGKQTVNSVRVVDVVPPVINEPDKTAAVDKKEIGKVVFSVPVIIFLIGVIAFFIVVPNIYGNTVSFIDWMISDPQNIIDTLRDSNVVLPKVYGIIGIKFFWWVWLACLIASLFFVGRQLHAKPEPNAANTILTKREPYLMMQDVYDALKSLKARTNDKRLDMVLYAAKRVKEKLSVESDFGYGKDIVINCENNIAKQLQFLLDIIPVADNGNIEENMKAINTAISNINSLLRKRTELKRR